MLGGVNVQAYGGSATDSILQARSVEHLISSSEEWRGKMELKVSGVMK